MTEWLIRHCVPDYEDVTNPKVRTAYGKFAGIVGIIANILLCLGKGIAGFASGSVSIIADAVNNLADASSNIISLLGFRLASIPPDTNHPYGHGRFEYLSGLTVAVLVLIIGFELIHSSIDKILHPEAVMFSWVLVGILVVSILIKLWLAAFNRLVGKRISSLTLEATAIDSRNDVISTAAVLAALMISQISSFNLDGYMGVAVGAFILWSGVGLVRDAIDPLLGRMPDPEFVQHIHDKVMSYPGVLGTHDLMVHDYGPGRQFASVHVEMAAEADVMRTHDLIDNIEQDFLHEDGLTMTIHYDPIVTSDERVGTLRSRISELVQQIHPGLTIHDLRCVPGPTHTNVLFDCVKPHDCPLSDEELRDQVVALVEAEDPAYVCKVVVDASYVSSRQ